MITAKCKLLIAKLCYFLNVNKLYLTTESEHDYVTAYNLHVWSAKTHVQVVGTVMLRLIYHFTFIQH